MVWTDSESDHVSIRSSNQVSGTQPFEVGLYRSPKLLDLNVYEDTGDGNRELRLSFRFLWFSLNMLICMLTAREDGQRFDDRDCRWGWYFIDTDFVMFWGKWSYYFAIPFRSLEHVRTEILSIDRQRVVYVEPKKGAFKAEEYQRRTNAEKASSASFPYRYECLNGDIQDVTATISVQRFTHRWKWTPFNRVRDSINITFSEEVGPRRGSWKGGCTGCGWTMEKGENAIQTLRRMERERRFER